MEVSYLNSFENDLKKIKDKKTKAKLKAIILQTKAAKNLQEVSGVNKMKGFSIAYRIRMGDYRVGIYYEDNKVEFARIANRKDIYKIFP